jgi:iron complex transport system ATP-binding protein
MSLRADRLALKRSASLVLKGANAALEQGQITAICGPNGAGKSTLLMGLAGLIEPEGGAVSLDGQQLSQISPQARAQRIGYLPQSTDIAWDVSVANLVRLGRMPHRDRGEGAVEAAISALDLGHLRERPASQLSGGEKARALLARVLAGEPEWILADEPLAALDLAHQLRLLSHLRAAADEGVGVVLVLHDLALAMNYADRVLVLSEGGIAADGVPFEAMSEEIIAKVWGVDARWIGEKGARALVTR